MNDRLEISSMFGAAIIGNLEALDDAAGEAVKFLTEPALRYADALIALEAETRKDEGVGNVATSAEIDMHMQGGK